FTDPQKYSPGTTMPVYKLPSKDLDRLTSYLMEIP
ncbi:MAG: cytochrome C, partial [Bryobacteraceae bacterium]|nr:cytochrome C [Bryobacteraceae bacterium]